MFQLCTVSSLQYNTCIYIYIYICMYMCVCRYFVYTQMLNFIFALGKTYKFSVLVCFFMFQLYTVSPLQYNTCIYTYTYICMYMRVYEGSFKEIFVCDDSPLHLSALLTDGGLWFFVSFSTFNVLEKDTHIPISFSLSNFLSLYYR